MPRRLLLVALAALGFGAMSAPARAGVANAGVVGAPASNPIAGVTWGVSVSPFDDVFKAYSAAGGQDRQLLGVIALRPRAAWFGSWVPDANAATAARQYIAGITGGNPSVLAQIAVFRVEPWEATACQRLPSPAEQASYKRWIDGFASGIGSSRVALILQPDLPFALCVPHGSHVPLALVAYAAREFGALPHTTVYIDAGASDWEGAGQAASLLSEAGVRYARGFALDTTHYDSTAREIAFGSQVLHALGTAHIAGRHFVINTAANGRPFTGQEYHGSHYDNAPVCASRASITCVTLGIPPTSDVANSRWGLPHSARSVATKSVDAYLWIGRPWLDNQADPFDRTRALALARTTPF